MFLVPIFYFCSQILFDISSFCHALLHSWQGSSSDLLENIFACASSHRSSSDTLLRTKRSRQTVNLGTVVVSVHAYTVTTVISNLSHMHVLFGLVLDSGVRIMHANTEL